MHHCFHMDTTCDVTMPIKKFKHKHKDRQEKKPKPVAFFLFFLFLFSVSSSFSITLANLEICVTHHKPKNVLFSFSFPKGLHGRLKQQCAAMSRCTQLTPSRRNSTRDPAFFLFHVRKLLSFHKAASWKSQLTIKKGTDLSIGAVISLQFSAPNRHCRTADRKTTTKQKHKATCVKTETERVVSTGYRPASAGDETTLLIHCHTLEDKKKSKQIW